MDTDTATLEALYARIIAAQTAVLGGRRPETSGFAALFFAILDALPGVSVEEFIAAYRWGTAHDEALGIRRI